MQPVHAKIVILGSQGVGKTSLSRRFVDRDCDITKIPNTIGACFSIRKIEVDGREAVLQIWDTAGQERYRCLTPMYYRGANAAFLVYDITNYQTFEEVKSWVDELCCNISEPIVICILANKCDMEDQREVSYEKGRQYAESIQGAYFETSAQSNKGIDDAFLHVASLLLQLDDMNNTRTVSTRSVSAVRGSLKLEDRVATVATALSRCC